MINALQAVLLLGFAVYVLGRRRTRGVAGLALVVATAGLVVLLELSGWKWAPLAETLAYGVGVWLAIFEPAWLLAHRGFAAEYEEVDRDVWQQLLRAEHDWRASRINDEEYSRVFDRSNVRYRALHPPPGEWREIVRERIRIREEWSRIFADPASSTESEHDQLGKAEAELRKKIARAVDEPEHLEIRRPWRTWHIHQSTDWCMKSGWWARGGWIASACGSASVVAKGRWPRGCALPLCCLAGAATQPFGGRGAGNAAPARKGLSTDQAGPQTLLMLATQRPV